MPFDIDAKTRQIVGIIGLELFYTLVYDVGDVFGSALACTFLEHFFHGFEHSGDALTMLTDLGQILPHHVHDILRVFDGLFAC